MFDVPLSACRRGDHVMWTAMVRDPLYYTTKRQDVSGIVMRRRGLEIHVVDCFDRDHVITLDPDGEAPAAIVWYHVRRGVRRRKAVDVWTISGDGQ